MPPTQPRSPFAPLSSMPPTQPRSPFTESNPNPNIPPHFEGRSLEGYDDASDPDYEIFKTIEGTLDDILDSVRPPLQGMSDYGTIGLCYVDEGFDPWKTPKVLAIMIEDESIHRWQEIDDQLRRVITTAYLQKHRGLPPVRYYAGGFSLLSLSLTSFRSIQNRIAPAHPGGSSRGQSTQTANVAAGGVNLPPSRGGIPIRGDSGRSGMPIRGYGGRGAGRETDRTGSQQPRTIRQQASNRSLRGDRSGRDDRPTRPPWR